MATSHEDLPMMADEPWDYDHFMAFLRSCEVDARLRLQIDHMEELIYEPLSKDDSIRLLELLPSTEDYDPIECNLFHARLQDKPKYEALSYCWGDPSTAVKIRVNSCAVETRGNLVNALQSFRLKDESRFLWVDAICINQMDLAERGQQVLMMRQVYQMANRVLIWLGRSNDNTEEIFKLIDNMVKAREATWRPNDTRHWKDIDDTTRREYGLPSDDQVAFMRWDSLFLSEWFQRVWVIQEVSVAQTATIYVGRFEIDWIRFQFANAWARDLNTLATRGSPAKAYKNVDLMGLAQHRYHTRAWARLLELLLCYRESESTDPRDKVYALLGLLTTPGMDRSLLVDYKSSVQDTFKRAALSVIQADKNLDILSIPHQDSLTMAGPTDLQLLSWVPDWRATNNPSISRMENILCLNLISSRKHPTFEASKGSKYELLLSDDNRLLGVEGMFLGLVQRISGALDDDENNAVRNARVHPVSMMQKAEAEALRILDWIDAGGTLSSDLYVTGEPMLEAFWKTMVAGQVEGFEAEAGTELFLGYLEHLADIRASAQSLEWVMLQTMIPRLSEQGQYEKEVEGLQIMLEMISPNEEYKKFRDHLWRTIYRRMMRTDTGYIGLAPRTTEVGDRVALLKGASVPILLRPNGDTWINVGEAYVHGIMYGEQWDEIKCESLWIS